MFVLRVCLRLLAAGWTSFISQSQAPCNVHTPTLCLPLDIHSNSNMTAVCLSPDLETLSYCPHLLFIYHSARIGQSDYMTKNTLRYRKLWKESWITDWLNLSLWLSLYKRSKDGPHWMLTVFLLLSFVATALCKSPNWSNSIRGCVWVKLQAGTLTGGPTILVRQTVSHVFTEETVASYLSLCLLYCAYIRIIFPLAVWI